MSISVAMVVLENTVIGHAQINDNNTLWRNTALLFISITDNFDQTGSSVGSWLILFWFRKCAMCKGLDIQVGYFKAPTKTVPIPYRNKNCESAAQRALSNESLKLSDVSLTRIVHRSYFGGSFQ